MTHSRSRVLPLLSLLCVGLWTLGHSSEAWSQKAAYVVQSKADVDGNGRADEVRLDDMGTITVDIAGNPKAGAWTALAAAGKIVGGSIAVDRKLDPKRRTIIVANSKLRTGSGRKHEETVILAWSPGKLTTLWRGPVGNTGSDGSKHISIELGSFGLIKYASRAGVDRCDGETAHLDAQRYDFATEKFRGVRQAVRVPASPQTPTLKTSASPNDPALQSAKGFWFRPVSASSSMQATSAADLVAPLALSDNDDQTAWVERKGGFGRGEFVTLKASVGKVQVKALRLVLGHGAARPDYNRPRRLALLLGKTKKFWIEIDKDPKVPQWVVLPTPVATDCISLVVDDVYPLAASKANSGRTAISEISIVSEEDLDPAKAGALLAKRIAQGKGNADLGRLLVAWGPAAAPSILQAIQETKNAQARLRLRLALARIPAGEAELVLGISTDGPGARQFRQLQQGLIKLQDQGVPVLKKALEGGALATEASARVIAVLVGIATPAAADALLSGLGKGSYEQRALLARTLGQDPSRLASILAALGESSPGPRQADLYRAASMAVAATSEDAPERHAFSLKLSEALSAASGLDFETHYQMLQAAARVGGDELIATLIRQVQAKAATKDAQSIALQEVRVAALASSLGLQPSLPPSAELKQALMQALADPNPGVRLALVDHLGSSKALLAGQTQRLETETWPEIRRALAASLSQHCDASEATTALAGATRKDKDEAVGRTALTALLRCKSAGVFPLLLELIDAKDRPLELRLYAARHAGSLATPSSHGELTKRFQKARTRSLTDTKSAKLAAALTVSLTDLASPSALELLEDSALDPAVPDLQAASLTGLAKLCRPSSKPILRQLKASTNPAVAMAARRASGRCR